MNHEKDLRKILNSIDSLNNGQPLKGDVLAKLINDIRHTAVVALSDRSVVQDVAEVLHIMFCSKGEKCNYIAEESLTDTWDRMEHKHWREVAEDIVGDFPITTKKEKVSPLVVNMLKSYMSLGREERSLAQRVMDFLLKVDPEFIYSSSPSHTDTQNAQLQDEEPVEDDLPF